MRKITGVVTSTKMSKTIVVRVDNNMTHPKYKKRYKVSTKFYAHDENESAQEGDLVTIIESRPLSKLKRWTLVQSN